MNIHIQVVARLQLSARETAEGYMCGVTETVFLVHPLLLRLRNERCLFLEEILGDMNTVHVCTSLDYLPRLREGN